MQVCLFKKFEDERPNAAGLDWSGLESGRGRGGRTRSGSSKSSPHHLGVWAGFSAENFPQLVCERAGTGGELLSGMQGPSPQGATATGTKSPPRTKSFGAVPIGGRSKWAGTGTWASRLAHPSCTIGADLEREDQGSDCERRPKKATSEKTERERKRRRNRRMHATTRRSRSNPRGFARSYCLLLGVFPLFPLPPSRLTRASASKGSIAYMPRALPTCAHLVVRRGKGAKRSYLSAPESFYCQFRTFPTTTTRPTECALLAVVRPPNIQPAVAALGNPKRRSSRRRSSLSMPMASACLF